MIATGGGVLFAVAPLAAVTALAIWLVIFVLLGYASVASLSTALCVPFMTWAYGYPIEVVAFTAVAVFIVLYLHRANVARLLHGREHRSRIAVLPRLRLQR